MVKDKVMNGYYFLDSVQISNLLQILKNSKNVQDKNLFSSLSFPRTEINLEFIPRFAMCADTTHAPPM